MSRLQRDFASIADQRFDLAIVGGGITGAGVARHAALAGLKTLLIEADDFASGTSSRSTKLIHGGLRYLAMGDIALVREGALERKSLKTMAPHLAQSQWMVVPAASRAELWKLRAGITTYEKLGAVERADRHQNWDAADLSDREPLLDRAHFPFACAYKEYLTDDARLVIAALRSAVAEGGVVCNYARLEAFEERDGEVILTVADALSGSVLSTRASVMVNAAGPWVEAVNARRTRGVVPGGDRLHLSKGVHIGLPRTQLPVRNMVMMTAPDGRPVFAIPRGTVTYVGTTDTSERGAPGHWPRVDPADVDYLLAPLRTYFPDTTPRAADVVSAWAGLRPLINQPGRAPKEMSRKEEIWVDGRTVTVAGGKLTGFRKMAEQVLAPVGRLLGRSVALQDPLARLPGGDCEDVEVLRSDIAARLDLDEIVSGRLARLYGSEIDRVLGAAPVRVSPGVYEEEIRWAVEQESAQTLVDLMYRRLRLPWFRPAETATVAAAAGTIMAGLLGWDAAELSRQRLAFEERERQDLSFKAG
ncbi:MAG: glycerol-3-phosphate dehydrogenase/oxidase [Pseudomonadales bacterium]